MTRRLDDSTTRRLEQESTRRPYALGRTPSFAVRRTTSSTPDASEIDRARAKSLEAGARLQISHTPFDESRRPTIGIGAYRGV